MSTSASILQELRERIAHIPLTNTHDHLRTEEQWLRLEPDLWYFFSPYACSDLMSSGMPLDVGESLHSKDLSQDEKWERIEPHLGKAANTSFLKAVDIAVRDIYGIPGLSRDTYPTLLERMKEVKKPGWYRQILRERANIEITILEAQQSGLDRSLFVPVLKTWPVTFMRTREELQREAERNGVDVYSLADYLRAADAHFEAGVRDGVIAVKFGWLPYWRTLSIDRPTTRDAEVVFNQIFRKRGEGASWEDAKPLQDYLIHYCIQKAADLGLVVEFHTGLQEGNGNFITDSDPTLLSNLFLTYKNVNFDIFHAGFPYSTELGVLAKNFPNVYPNMCWMHIIGEQPARNMLDEWLDLVPSNKILAFGADYGHVEGTYAHSKMARENVARVLADRVSRGNQSMREAEEIAVRIVRLNGRELYGLDQ